MDSWTVFEWELDVQNTLKDVALPVHLLRQVYLEAIPIYFFAYFFKRKNKLESLVFGRILEPKMEAKSMKNGVKIEVETHIDFYVVFSRC